MVCNVFNLEQIAQFLDFAGLGRLVCGSLRMTEVNDEGLPRISTAKVLKANVAVNDISLVHRFQGCKKTYSRIEPEHKRERSKGIPYFTEKGESDPWRQRDTPAKERINA